MTEKNPFEERKTEFHNYLKEARELRDALRSDPEHKELRKNIDLLNSKTMFNIRNNARTKVTRDVVETEYDPNTGHYVQVDCPRNNANETETMGLDAQSMALRGIRKMKPKPLGQFVDVDIGGIEK